MIDTFLNMRNLVKSYKVSGFNTFIHEQLSAFYMSNRDIFNETLLAIVVGLPIILCIVFVVTRHVKATFYVFLMVVATDVELLGLGYWLGQDFDFFLVYVY
eukprot:UN34356